ncbi:MAG: class I SAM-dependent methyltransferase [Bacteroidota bacterium]
MPDLSQIIYRILGYLKYLWKAKGLHGIHSPFAFNLLNLTIRTDGEFYVFDKLERHRERLLRNQESIDIIDFGAGSSISNNRQRKIADIARYSLQSKKYSWLLFRLTNHFQPKNMLELGTSLGLTSLYQIHPVSGGKMITLEGSPSIAKIATETFMKFRQANIEIITGNFDDTLADAIKKLKRLDYVYFDGNHRLEPTMRYFNQCLEHTHEDTFFIFDDIHWSKEMEQAWYEIKKDARVTITIDLFKIGIVFFRKGQVKQDFILRF